MSQGLSSGVFLHVPIGAPARISKPKCIRVGERVYECTSMYSRGGPRVSITERYRRSDDGTWQTEMDFLIRNPGVRRE